MLPHGLIAAEVQELAAYGISARDALAAASWEARSWLGAPGRLAEGDPADFVVYETDPVTTSSPVTPVAHRPARRVVR